MTREATDPRLGRSLNKSDIYFQVIQLQPSQVATSMAPPAPGSIQIVQPIVGPGGDIQQIPIQLTNQQLSMIRGHLTGKSSIISG